MSEDRDKWLDRTKKLLALAENTTNADEAKSFNEKAMYIMAKHSITSAMLQVAGKETPDTVESISIQLDNPYSTTKNELLTIICNAFEVQAVQVSGWAYDGNGKKQRTRKKVIFGYKQDLEKVQMLYSSLFIQLVSNMMATPIPWNEHGKTFRAAFAIGFTKEIYRRLRETKATVKKESAPGTDLVLASRMEIVTAERDKVFPKLVNARGMSAQRSSGRSYGQKAGREADLGGRKLGGNTRMIGN